MPECRACAQVLVVRHLCTTRSSSLAGRWASVIVPDLLSRAGQCYLDIRLIASGTLVVVAAAAAAVAASRKEEESQTLACSLSGPRNSCVQCASPGFKVLLALYLLAFRTPSIGMSCGQEEKGVLYCEDLDSKLQCI